MVSQDQKNFLGKNVQRKHYKFIKDNYNNRKKYKKYSQIY